jgi:Domain of unknown function (DUF6468)
VNHYIGLFIEGTVAVLLVVTIGYCFLLDRRLRRFRADENLLKATIGELITPTEIAERAIAGLKLTVRECDHNLGDRLRAAERFSADIEQQIAEGHSILRRIAQIAAAGRPGQPAPPPVPTTNTQSTLAAAQAFVERSRSRASDLAA